MKPVELDTLKNWFAGYTAGYLTKSADHDRAIHLKIDHTQRVCQNIIMLARAMNLSENDLLLAETMGLLHDIGRFEQYAIYGTFSDMASENHARMGMRQIAKHKLLAIFTLPEKRLIAGAVAFHNAATLPRGKSSRQLFFMKLLRDADKLDIWKVVTDYYSNQDSGRNKTLELDLSVDPEYSQEILLALNEKKIIRMEKLKTLNDFKLLQLSWVYDLNFSFSFETLLEHGYIDRIAASLPQTDEIVSMVNQVRRYAEVQLHPL